jgi:hypothetical protein
MFKIGDKVTYITEYKKEIGIIKEVFEESQVAFVVYKCNDNWENYKNYTGCLTNFKNLQLNWIK